MTPIIHTDVLTGRDVVTGLELAYPVAWEERPIRSCPRCGQDVPADPGCPVILNTGAGQGGQIEPVSLQHGCGEWLGIAWTEGYDGQDPAELAAKFRAELEAEDGPDDDEEQDDEDDPSEIIRAKWAMDGATTLEDAARLLEAKAAELRLMAAEGWQLTGPVDDDYGFIERTEPTPVVAAWAGESDKLAQLRTEAERLHRIAEIALATADRAADASDEARRLANDAGHRLVAGRAASLRTPKG